MKTFNNKDPPWITSAIKKMITEKNTVSKKAKKNPNKQIKVRSLQRQLKILLEKFKRMLEICGKFICKPLKMIF